MESNVERPSVTIYTNYSPASHILSGIALKDVYEHFRVSVLRGSGWAHWHTHLTKDPQVPKGWTIKKAHYQELCDKLREYNIPYTVVPVVAVAKPKVKKTRAKKAKTTKTTKIAPLQEKSVLTNLDYNGGTEFPIVNGHVGIEGGKLYTNLKEHTGRSGWGDTRFPAKAGNRSSDPLAGPSDSDETDSDDDWEESKKKTVVVTSAPVEKEMPDLVESFSESTDNSDDYSGEEREPVDKHIQFRDSSTAVDVAQYMAIIEESEYHEHLNVGTIKELTGGDTYKPSDIRSEDLIGMNAAIEQLGRSVMISYPRPHFQLPATIRFVSTPLVTGTGSEAGIVEIENFGNDITEKDVRHLFGQYGVIDVQYHAPTGSGSIAYTDIKDAKTAIMNILGKEIGGKRIYLA